MDSTSNNEQRRHLDSLAPGYAAWNSPKKRGSEGVINFGFTGTKIEPHIYRIKSDVITATPAGQNSYPNVYKLQYFVCSLQKLTVYYDLDNEFLLRTDHF